MNSNATQRVVFMEPGHPPSGSERLLPVRVAYAALAWVVVFFAFHIYWYLGGSFGSPGQLPDLVPHHLVGWILEPLGAAWPLGAWVCLAIARGWPQGRMRRAASIVVWLGCTVLVVRGAAGLIDDLTRAVGLLPNGITGLSHKHTMGAAYYRSASVLWSNNVIDAYFFAGGLLFGLLAHRYRPPDQRLDETAVVDLQLTACFRRARKSAWPTAARNETTGTRRVHKRGPTRQSVGIGPGGSVAESEPNR